MADLAPRPAWAGLELPLFVGGVTLAAAVDMPMVSIAPLRGRAGAVAEALGAPLPEPGRTAVLRDGHELIWAGLDLWFLRGPGAVSRIAGPLAEVAALTDQSDAWSALILDGARAREVLARLVPIDLARAAFPSGSVARTELRHMMCMMIARERGFEALIMRSFVTSAVHEIATAMRGVAARAQLEC